MSAGETVGFSVFEVNLSSGELRRHGLRIRLQDQPFRLLAVLLERPGELVTREELHHRLWPGGVFVDFDHSLNIAVTRLRRALSDPAGTPRFIETIARQGYRFIAPVARPAAERWPAPVQKEQGIRLAVLPFANLSADSEQDCFTDGITEELTTQLACLEPERLRVIARASCLKYKRSDKGIAEIGRELNVAYVLEGAVRCSGDQLRITVQLIRVQDETHVCARSYDYRLSDALWAQCEVAGDLGRCLQAQLLGGGQPRPHRPLSQGRRRGAFS
jgi:TolB-like protein